MAQSATAVLHVLTTEPMPPSNLVMLDNTIECTDTYTCPCLRCELDRAKHVQRGVRHSEPIPIRRKAA